MTAQTASNTADRDASTDAPDTRRSGAERAAPDGSTGEITALLAIMERLRDPQTGCPWDVEQSFASIVPYTIEEAYEVADAVERDDFEDLCDELGDLLLQVVFHAQMAREAGHFTFEDVVAGICRKMVRRHPHVFSDIDRDDPNAVKQRWEAIKRQEKEERQARRAATNAANGKAETAEAPLRTLDGVPTTLPPLQRAFKLQAKAARVGFDWPSAARVMAKLREETDEVEAEIHAEAADKTRIQDEIGDLLFVVTNLARKLDIDPAQALDGTNRKFVKRFNWLEDELRATGSSVEAASLDEMEAAWQRAKTHD